MSEDLERIRTIIVHDHDDLAVLVADRIVDVILRAVARKGYCVLGLATGSTPLGVYQELVRRYRAREVSFANVATFNLDEYYPMPADSRSDNCPYITPTSRGRTRLPRSTTGLDAACSSTRTG